MKRFLLPLALVAALVATTGCSSSSSPFDPETTAELLQDCGLEGFLVFLAIFDNLGDVVDEISNGDDSPDVTITPTGNEFEWDFVVTLDTTGNGLSDTTLDGTITFDDDPTDGTVPGDTATLAVTQTSSATPNAVATLGLELTDGGVNVTGTTAITGVSSCNVNFTIPVATPLIISFLDQLRDERQVAGLQLPNFLAFGVMGQFNMTVTGAGATLSSTVILDGSNGVLFSNPVINQIELDDLFTVIPAGDELLQTLQCALAGIFGMDEVAFVIEDIIDAVLNGETSIDEGAFTAVPVPGQANTFDITLSGDATITARVSLPGDPTAGPLTGIITVSTWRFDNTVTTGFFFGDGVGQSTSPLIIDIDNNQLQSYYGTASFTESPCLATISVPASNPITADSGEFSVSGADALHEVAFRLVSDGEALFDEVIITDGVIDEINVPGEILAALLEFVLF
ncbi:MAG: hypothetical protein OER88_00660 [Planctomycetota bacterium]|nr:hypothetical protein [Planctomycetota bacterium]